MIFSLTGKAIGAVQIARVRDVQAQRLDYIAGTFLESSCHGREGIRRKQLTVSLQRGDVIGAVAQIRLGHIRAVCVPAQHLPDECFTVGALPCGNHIIGDIVHCMDSTGAGVQHDVVAVQFILV